MRASTHTTAIAAKPRRAPLFLAANDFHAEVVVGGLKTAAVSRQELAFIMVRDCLFARRDKHSSPKLVFSSNGNCVARAALDEDFRALLEGADILHADGLPIVAAARLLTRTPIPERCATTDFIHDAADAAIETGLRFFLLGATEEVNKAAAEALLRDHPGLQIVGRRHGYFSPDEEVEICAEINRTGADVVWVGLGVPFEQEFAARNKDALRAGWIVTCGGCFNFACGDYVRAPQWMQAAGLEWLHRVWREPRRLFWRYAITNPVALMILLLRTADVGEGAPVIAQSEAPAQLAQQTRYAR
jgi:exopolysaccharide biosynthesis WecB/TagA/CpsF family protein